MTKVSKPLQKVRPQEKDRMRETLKRFRDKNDFRSISICLGTFPFANASALFGIENGRTPCHWLGRHLVLKIIDEILDTGKEIT